MKNLFRYVLMASVLILPALSLAATFRLSENPSVGKDEKISSDIYLVGGSVTSSGSVDGDLVVAGGNVVVSGDVKEDLLVGGGNVTVFSNIGDDARIGGGTVIVAGKVAGDLVIGGGNITLSGSGVGGDVAVGGGNVRIDAPVLGDLLIGGGTVYVNAPIGGNVKITAEKVTLGSNAVIDGNLTYRSSSEMVKEDGAVVKGVVDFKLLKDKVGSSAKKFSADFLSALVLWKFFTLLACSLLVGLSLKRYGKEIVSMAMERPWFEMGRGLLVAIVMPIVSIMLLVTVIGIPLGIVGLLGFVILMIFACIVTPIILGTIAYGYLSKKELEVSWKTILLGVFLYVVIGLVPFVGCLIQMLLALITIGAMVALKLKVLKEWR